ncbi:hypothetical protein BT69DRAFT_1349164 [Atractiella rhizophila]|nr:hypothetical protein BT69DRAFT_1349164 [Atractiella rhizophila]
MAFSIPNLRAIFSSFRTPAQDRHASRVAFFRFLTFALVSVGIGILGGRNRRAAIGHHFSGRP